jgi:hypothetical protein
LWGTKKRIGISKMALSSANWVRPKLATTLNEAVTQTGKLYDDTANGRFVFDVYATVNAALRLEKRFLITPSGYAGGSLILTIAELDYSALAASTYVDTDLASATGTPFTIAAGGTPKVIGTSSTLNLDTFYTLAGDARANT